MSNTLITCPHCQGEKVGARITSGAQLPDEDGETRYFFVTVCSKCGFPSIIVARRTASRLADGRALIKHVCRTERDPIPNFIEPVGMIPAADAVETPNDLPANVASAYAEARDCLRRGSVISAAMGFRLTLERATRVLNGDASKPLAERIAALVDNHSLPPTLGKWADEIELIRGALDDRDSDPTPEELHKAGGFIEMFLTCAFSLPAQIDERRGAESGPDEAAAEAENPYPAREANLTPVGAGPPQPGAGRKPGPALHRL